MSFLELPKRFSRAVNWVAFSPKDVITLSLHCRLHFRLLTTPTLLCSSLTCPLQSTAAAFVTLIGMATLVTMAGVSSAR